MLIVLIFIITGVIITQLAIKFKPKGFMAKEDRVLTCVLVILWWVGLIAATGGIRFNNGIELEKLRVFATIDKPNIELAIEKTTNYLNETNKTEWGIEKVALYQKTSDRIGELVQQTAQYNKLLVGYLIYKQNPFTSWFVPSIEGLKLIKFESFEGEK